MWSLERPPWELEERWRPLLSGWLAIPSSLLASDYVCAVVCVPATGSFKPWIWCEEEEVESSLPRWWLGVKQSFD